MEWQPIETAPKDGTLILAYTSNYGMGDDYAVVSWNKLYKEWWLLINGPYVDNEEFNPTHWQPFNLYKKGQ